MPTLEQAKEIFEKQLKDCQVEYFDYYLLHTLQTLDVYQEIYEKRGILPTCRNRNAGDASAVWAFRSTAPVP